MVIRTVSYCIASPPTIPCRSLPRLIRTGHSRASTEGDRRKDGAPADPLERLSTAVCPSTRFSHSRPGPFIRPKAPHQRHPSSQPAEFSLILSSGLPLPIDLHAGEKATTEKAPVGRGCRYFFPRCLGVVIMRGFCVGAATRPPLRRRSTSPGWAPSRTMLMRCIVNDQAHHSSQTLEGFQVRPFCGDGGRICSSSNDPSKLPNTVTQTPNGTSNPLL